MLRPLRIGSGGVLERLTDEALARGIESGELVPQAISSAGMGLAAIHFEQAKA